MTMVIPQNVQVPHFILYVPSRCHVISRWRQRIQLSLSEDLFLLFHELPPTSIKQIRRGCYLFLSLPIIVNLLGHLLRLVNSALLKCLVEVWILHDDLLELGKRNL